MKRVLTPLATACMLACAGLSVPAHALPYSSLVVFGDSLSDAGQFPDFGGAADGTLRFTNRTGPTYQAGNGEAFGATAPMLLGGRLGLGGLGPSTSPVFEANGWADGNNWAVGGYTTSQILESITSVSQTVIPQGDPGAGTVLRERPGYLVGTGLRADPKALYYINGGGNDFLQLQVTSTATAHDSASRLVDSVEALQQAGARYIMVWLLPDVGRTPALAGTPLSGTFSQLGATFNDELVRQLAGVNAEIIPLNVPLYINELVLDPTRYGLAAGQDLIRTCFDDCPVQNPIYGINGASPDPSKLLYDDGVHPTIAGQTLIAGYAYSLLAAPWELSLLPEMAHSTLRAHQDQLRAEWQADWLDWQAVGQWRSFVTAGGQRQSYDVYESDADGDGYSLNVGGSYRLNDVWRVGLAAGFYEQDMEAGDADSEYDLRSYLATGFAQYQQNGWWGELVASVGYLDYDDIKRQFNLGPATRSEKGDTEGALWSLSGRVGYDIAPGTDSRWHLSPFVSADYARVEVDGYAENSVSSTALNVGDQKRDSKRLGAGVQGLLNLNPQTRVFGEVAMEREYEDDATEVDMALRSLPTLGYTLEGYTPDDKTWRASVGVSHSLAPGLSLRGAYTYRGADDSAQQGINLSLAWDI